MGSSIKKIVAAEIERISQIEVTESMREYPVYYDYIMNALNEYLVLNHSTFTYSDRLEITGNSGQWVEALQKELDKERTIEISLSYGSFKSHICTILQITQEIYVKERSIVQLLNTEYFNGTLVSEPCPFYLKSVSPSTQVKPGFSTYTKARNLTEIVNFGLVSYEYFDAVYAQLGLYGLFSALNLWSFFRGEVWERICRNKPLRYEFSEIQKYVVLLLRSLEAFSYDVILQNEQLFEVYQRFSDMVLTDIDFLCTYANVANMETTKFVNGSDHICNVSNLLYS